MNSNNPNQLPIIPPRESESDRQLRYAAEVRSGAEGSLTWEEAVAAVNQVEDLHRLSIIPTGFNKLAAHALANRLRNHPVMAVQVTDAIERMKGHEPSLMDFATDPRRMFGVAGALDTCLRYGGPDLRLTSLTYAIDLGSAVTHGGTAEAASVYAATFVELGNDFAARLAETRFPDMDGAERQQLVDEANQFARTYAPIQG